MSGETCAVRVLRDYQDVKVYELTKLHIYKTGSVLGMFCVSILLRCTMRLQNNLMFESELHAEKLDSAQPEYEA